MVNILTSLKKSLCTENYNIIEKANAFPMMYFLCLEEFLWYGEIVSHDSPDCNLNWNTADMVLLPRSH